MEYKKLAASSLRVSRMALGTMTFGGQTQEADAIAIMKHAYDCGVNFFDTADIYPDANERCVSGDSERIIGKALKEIGRSNIILATKLRYPVGDGINNSGLSRHRIIEACEDSLRRLNTDHIDMYYMHLPDDDTNMEESLYAMNDLLRAGKVCYIGVANFAAWEIVDTLWTADRRNLIAPSITQNPYNLLTRSIETEFVPMIQRHRLSFTVYNPLCGGLLTGKHRWEDGPRPGTRFSEDAMYRKRYWTQANFEAIEQLKKIAEEAGISLVELAMRWVISHDYVTSAVAGFSRMEQFDQNVKMFEQGPLSPDTMTACDAIWHTLAGSQYNYITDQRRG